MKNGLKVLIGIFMAILMVGVWFFGTINTLSLFNEEFKSEQLRIGTTLQARNNLIPGIIQVISSYVTDEEVFKEVDDARLKLVKSIESEDMESIIEANNGLDSALGRLLAISENYPILKSSQRFMELQDELTIVENRIDLLKNYYNDRVKIYNKLVKYIPESIIAKMYGYHPMPKFKNS